MTPELQAILDRFDAAANAAVDRARRRVVEWRLKNAQIEYNRHSVTALEPSGGFDTYMGVPLGDLLSGKEDWPA